MVGPHADESRWRRQIRSVPKLPFLVCESIAWIFWHSICCPCFARSHCRDAVDLYDDWRMKKKDKTAPKVVTTRPTSLTAPSPTEGSTGKICDQRDSVLFGLPAEIRLQIYRYYFGADEEIVVLFQDGVIHASNNLPTQLARRVERRDDCSMKIPGAVSFLPLLCTCRKIYSEAAHLLYESPTFSFPNPISFLAFSATILPIKLNSIRTLQLNFERQLPHWISPKTLYHPREFRLDQSGRPSRSLPSVPPYRTPQLQDELSYRAFHAKDYCRIRQYYNKLPDVDELLSNPAGPTFWAAVCTLLATMTELRSLYISLRVGKVDNEKAELQALNELRLERFDNLSSFVVDVSGFYSSRRGLGWKQTWERSIKNGEMIWTPLPDT
ncbi:hypothetical protein EJ04DRAFT_514543 [Polyplosphaeria fusca]|uniref:DUF7730 domain-containing protein n=1 Tax=Polyplosphaeria fusca TaxID=682080 RepID=A0A9P4QV52_9PLEO|nr:hypothetical protein EJ04DRAFT_514543 [Polyplosphaeria fusca]